MSIRVTIANRYDKKLWVKCDYDYELGGGVGIALGSAGVSAGKSKQFDWRKIEMQLTPINGGSYEHFYFDPKETSTIYLTILTEDKIVCQAVPKSVKKCYVVTERREVREADKEKHWAIKG